MIQVAGTRHELYVYILQLQEQVTSLNNEIAVIKDANEKLVSRYLAICAKPQAITLC